MDQKMWLRRIKLLVFPLLFMIVMGACSLFGNGPSSPSPTPAQDNPVADCLKISLPSPNTDEIEDSIKDFFDHDRIGGEARLMPGTKSTRSDEPGSCIQSYNTKVNLNTQPPVGIYQLSDTTIQYTYQDSVPNCTDQYQSYQGTIPVELVVGTLENNQLQPQGTYVDPSYSKATGYTPLPPPNGQKVQDQIAQALYNSSKLYEYFNSESEKFTVPLPANAANSTVQINLTLTLNVKTGWGDVFQGESKQVMNWVYNYGIQLPNDPTSQMTVTPCG